MPISVNWWTQVIFVPQSYLTSLGAGVYELDVNQFRLDLKDLEDDEGMPFLDTHEHIQEVTLSGTPYARFVIIKNGYTVEFEDGQYQVNPVGANHNLLDVKVLNQVSLGVTNSAGLISVEGTNQAALVALLASIVDILEADEEIRPGTYTKLRRGTSDILFTKTVTPTQGTTLDLTE